MLAGFTAAALDPLKQDPRVRSLTVRQLRDAVGELLELCVPKTLSMSCGQAMFVDQATAASLFSDAVLAEIDWFG